MWNVTVRCLVIGMDWWWVDIVLRLFFLLIVNDYSIEGINRKSNALYNFTRHLKDQGLLDGIGFQTHLIVGQVPRGKQEVRNDQHPGPSVKLSAYKKWRGFCLFWFKILKRTSSVLGHWVAKKTFLNPFDRAFVTEFLTSCRIVCFDIIVRWY